MSANYIGRTRSRNNRLVTCPFVWDTSTAEKERLEFKSAKSMDPLATLQAPVFSTQASRQRRQGGISGMKSANSQKWKMVLFYVPIFSRHGRSMAMSTASDSVRGAAGSTLQCRRGTRHMRSWAEGSMPVMSCHVM